MNLYLTIQGKLVDTIIIDPLKRRDKAYMESMKLALIEKHRDNLQGTGSTAIFHTDRYYHEVHALTSFA